MKNVLFATTALVMTAGVAAAEVTLSGDGRMGVVYDGTDWNFSSRARVKFTLSGETDGGLTFGGSFRAHQAGPSASTTLVREAGPDLILGNGDDVFTLVSTTGGGASNGGKGSVYISGAFGKISMGDVDAASEAAVGQISGVGYTSLGSGQSISYIGAAGAAGDPAMLYEYSNGDLSLYLGMNDGSPEEDYGLGLKYTMGDYTFGIGYEEDSGFSGYYVGGSATFGAATVKVVYGDDDYYGQQYGVSLDYTVNALTVTAYYADTYLGAGEVLGNDGVNYGIGAAYDLGGGASVVGGVADYSDLGETRADVGVKFSF